MASPVTTAVLSLLFALPVVPMQAGAGEARFRVPPNALVEPTKDRGVQRISWSVESREDGMLSRIHVSYPRLTEAFGPGFEALSRLLEADVIETNELSERMKPIERDDTEAGESAEGETAEDEARVYESWYDSSIAFRRGPLVSVQWEARSEGGAHPDAFFGGLLFIVEAGKIRKIEAVEIFTAPDAAERVVALLKPQVPEEMRDSCLDEQDLSSAVFAPEGIRLTLRRGCIYTPLLLPYDQAAPLIDPIIAGYLAPEPGE